MHKVYLYLYFFCLTAYSGPAGIPGGVRNHNKRNPLIRSGRKGGRHIRKEQEMKTIIRRLTAFISAVLLCLGCLTGCGFDDEDFEDFEDYEDYGDYEDYDTEDYSEDPSVQESSPSSKKTPAVKSDGSWTIMVYMCGTDLESDGECATGNLYEMFASDLGVNRDKINILVETGGTKSWAMNDYYVGEMDKFNGIDSHKLGYYRIEEYDMVCEKELPLASMGDPKTLKEYISWGKENYPADKYALILWDHGGGSLGGVCVDELHDGDCLSLPELKKAVTEADVPFEMIGFDACLMATLETAQALQGYGHYMVASEEIEPGTGWNYTDFLEFLGKNTDISGLDLGKQIADGYMAKCREYDSDAMSTLSVTDLTMIPTLSTVYKQFSGEMLLSTQEADSFRSVQQGVSKAENFGSNTESEGYTNMVDLGDLVKHTEDVLSDFSPDVKNALAETVLYEVHGSSRANSHGLAVYYPLSVDEEELSLYKELSNNIEFQEYASILAGNFDPLDWEEEWKSAWEDAYSTVEKEGAYDSYFNGGQSTASEQVQSQEQTETYYETLGGVSPVQKKDYDLKFSQSRNKDGYYELKISSGLDMVKDVIFMLYFRDPESGEYIYLGSDNDLETDYDKGVFTENFSGTWITLGDEFVYAELIENNDDYNLYTIPILLNGKEKHLKAEYRYDSQKFSILGAYDGLDQETGQSGRDVKQLKNGDKIEFLFYTFTDDENDDEMDLVSMGDLTWRDGMTMEDSELGDGEFIYMFEIDSVFGDSDFGDPIFMEVENGEVYTD